jgi:isopentenyl diphosphate isomerase/L-lactate dehydrogenase-like FMN-dependent dehydrogenase
MAAERGKAEDWATVSEILEAAHRRMTPEARDYVEGGADSETTLRRNREAYDGWALRPRILRDVRNIDMSTRILGLPVSLPVFPTAIGSLNLLHPDGALEVARGAVAAGTTSMVGILPTPDFETIGREIGRPLMFQIYVRGDDDWLAEIARRAEDAGYYALALTVDSAVYGRRERDLINRFSSRKAVDRPALAGTDAARRAEFQAATDWRSLERLRASTSLPLVLKGVMDGEDARIALEAGVDGIYVSNHGGRQLDHAPSSLDGLEEIADAVGGRTEILFDGGVMRGTDILKALCLGATAVGLGKLQALALAAGGQAAVQRMLRILAEEVRNSLALMGQTSLAGLDRSCLRRMR